MESLIQKAKKKDPNAFTELMQSQMKNMYRTAVEADVSNLEWKEALAALDEKYRLVLVLFYSEGFHTKEKREPKLPLFCVTVIDIKMDRKFPSFCKPSSSYSQTLWIPKYELEFQEVSPILSFACSEEVL